MLVGSRQLLWVSHAQTRVLSEYMKPRLYSVRTAQPLQPPILLTESSNVSNMLHNPYCRGRTPYKLLGVCMLPMDVLCTGLSAFACCRSRGRTQCRLLGLHTLRFQTTFLQTLLYALFSSFSSAFSSGLVSAGPENIPPYSFQ